MYPIRIFIFIHAVFIFIWIDGYLLKTNLSHQPNGKPIFTLNEKGVESEQLLDGMTIDAEGNLWVAVFHYTTQSRVIKIDPQKPGAIVETIQIPAAEVTSVAFGGPNLDELYVTSGRVPIRNVAPSSSNDGATYRVRGLNAKGLPGVRIVL